MSPLSLLPASIEKFREAQAISPYYLLARITFPSGEMKLFDGKNFFSKQTGIASDLKVSVFVKQCFQVSFQDGKYSKVDEDSSFTHLREYDINSMDERQRNLFFTAFGLNHSIFDANSKNEIGKCQFIVASYFKDDEKDEKARWLISAIGLINEARHKFMAEVALNVLAERRQRESSCH